MSTGFNRKPTIAPQSSDLDDSSLATVVFLLSGLGLLVGLGLGGYYLVTHVPKFVF
jgi:hypothetical protein